MDPHPEEFPFDTGAASCGAVPFPSLAMLPTASSMSSVQLNLTALKARLAPDTHATLHARNAKSETPLVHHGIQACVGGCVVRLSGRAKDCGSR